MVHSDSPRASWVAWGCLWSGIAILIGATTTLAVLAISNDELPGSFTYTLRHADTTAITFHHRDIPVILPLIDLPPDRNANRLVKASFEESVHFALQGNQSIREFGQMLPYGSVILRFGQQHRALAPAIFHEEHCYRLMHATLARSKIGDLGHIAHCLNYIRQLVLCRADLSPELGDFHGRNFSEDRAGPVRVCRDWEAMYDAAGYNWLEWVHVAKHRNISLTTPGPL